MKRRCKREGEEGEKKKARMQKIGNEDGAKSAEEEEKRGIERWNMKEGGKKRSKGEGEEERRGENEWRWFAGRKG